MLIVEPITMGVAPTLYEVLHSLVLPFHSDSAERVIMPSWTLLRHENLYEFSFTGIVPKPERSMIYIFSIACRYQTDSGNIIAK